jgi:hypothetical protein
MDVREVLNFFPAFPVVNQPCDITLTATDLAGKWRLLASVNLLHFFSSISPICGAINTRGSQAWLHGIAKITFS